MTNKSPLDEAISFVGQALHDFSTTMLPSQRAAFDPVSQSAFSMIVNAVRQPASTVQAAGPNDAPAN